MANSTLIGALRVEFSADTAKFIEGTKRVKSEAASTEKSLKKSFGNIGGIIKGGLAGLAAGLSVGLFTRAIGQALDYASSIGDISRQLNITSKDLQGFRYAASQSGAEQADLDRGLQHLANTLAKVAAGAERPTRAFKALGIEAKELEKLDTGEALRLIADRLAEVPDRAERAAVELELFGEAGSRLDQLLSGGSDKINELAGAAERLGIVLSDEQIQKADETARKLDDLKTVLGARIAATVADNTDAIDRFAVSLADLADAAAKALVELDELGKGWRAGESFWQSKSPFLSASDRAAANQRWQAWANPRRTPAVTLQDIMGVDVGAQINREFGSTGTRRVGDFLAPRTRSGRRGPDLEKQRERERLQALREAFRFAQELKQADADILRARQDLVTSASERAAIELELINLQGEMQASEREYAVAAGEMTQAQADALKAKQEQVLALDRQAVLADMDADIAEGMARLREADFDNQRDLLASELQLAETAAEQRDVRLRLLDLAYRQERARLEAVIADESSSDYAKQEAMRRLAILGQLQANDRQATINSTRGPMASYLSGLPTTAAKWEEALEGVRVRGFEALEDGVLGVITGVESLGSAFHSIAAQILADLARIAIQRAIIGPLAGALFPGGGGGPTDLLAGIPGFASGGSMMLGGIGGHDRNILSLNGMPVARVSRGERLDIVPGGGAGGGWSGNLIQNFSGTVDRKTALQAAKDAGREISRAQRRGY